MAVRTDSAHIRIFYVNLKYLLIGMVGIGPRDALKDSRGLFRRAAGNPRYPRLLPGTLQTLIPDSKT